MEYPKSSIFPGFLSYFARLMTLAFEVDPSLSPPQGALASLAQDSLNLLCRSLPLTLQVEAKSFFPSGILSSPTKDL